MSLDADIDAFVRHQSELGHSFRAISNAPFSIREIQFFGNAGTGEHDDLVVASLRDAVLARVCQRNGFIQIGRPSTGEYDPVCLDMSRRSKHGEAPIVRLDHEEISIHERTRIVCELAKSFRELLVAGQVD